MGYQEHKKKAVAQVGCAVLTISDTRSGGSDESGQLIRGKLEEAGHQVYHYQIIGNQDSAVRREIEHLLDNKQVSVILTTGGTGISQRDITIEAVLPYLEKRIGGFGELFRYLSYEEIGSGSIMSRALAGVVRGKIIICLPGSPDAVRLALEKLILPELGHVVWEATK